MYLKVDGLVAVACSAVPAIRASAVVVTEDNAKTARGSVRRHLHLKGKGVRKNVERISHSPLFGIAFAEGHSRILSRKGAKRRYGDKAYEHYYSYQKCRYSFHIRFFLPYEYNYLFSLYHSFSIYSS
jgi:hypothetical protein